MNFKKKMTIGMKITLGFLVILIIFAGTNLFSYERMSTMSKTYDELLNDKARKLIMIQEINVIIKREQLAIRGYLLSEDQEAYKALDTHHETFQKLTDNLQGTLTHEVAKELLQELKALESQFYKLAHQEAELKKQGKDAEAMALVNGKGKEINTTFDNKLDEFVKYQQQLMEAGQSQTVKKVQETKNLVLILCVAALFVGIIFIVFIVRMISKPIGIVTKAAKEIAKGNLAIPEVVVKAKDETGELAASFNEMTESLRTLIYHVSSGAEQVAASSEELTASAEHTVLVTDQVSSAMQSVASTVEVQFKAVEETSRTVGEMSLGIREIAESTQQAADQAMTTHDRAASGVEAIQTVVGQMNTIQNTFDHLSSTIHELEERSNEINEIISAITEIASQTNLLALNAAIEASRAGEQGRGFAIVASEIRKLADQSTTSANKISGLIVSIQSETHKAVQSMTIASDEVHAGMKVVHRAGESFEQIQESINSVAGQIQHVSSAVQQMAAGSEQIVQSMCYLGSVSETTSAATQEVTASAEEQETTAREISAASASLAQLAEELLVQLERFKV